MRRCRLLLLTLLASLPLSGQTVVGNLLRFPDKVMSGNRIGRISQHQGLALPEWDFTPVVFPDGGTRPLGADADFLRHLRDNRLDSDLLTLLQQPYAPSDTLTYLRGISLFDKRKISQAADLLASVPADSPSAVPARLHAAVAEAYLGDYTRAVRLIPTDAGPYHSIAAYQRGALALMQGDGKAWEAARKDIDAQDYALSEGLRVMDDIARTRFETRQKSPWLAGMLSAVLPGSGKIYAGRVGEGVSALLTVGGLGAITAEQWKKHGSRSWQTLAAGSLCAIFYLGNIYGSYLSVSIENDERLASENTLLLYHLHIPLRSLFR